MSGPKLILKTSDNEIPEHLRAQPEPPPGIEAMLSVRQSSYGEFADHARISQGLKGAMHDAHNWGLLANDMREALDMMANKIARILNGDPSHVDSWTDIIGYSRLIEKRLQRGDK
ncbi:MAG: DUF6378 domain-containing protein [Gammaproteobacteria bacterium]